MALKPAQKGKKQTTSFKTKDGRTISFGSHAKKTGPVPKQLKPFVFKKK